MQLVIPMSGIGERFIRAGYKIPKPLLKIENKTFINHIYNMFDDIETVIFICNKNHLSNQSISMYKEIKKINSNAKIISIEKHKLGPIYAVMQAINHLDLNIPTIVNYCDFNCIWNYHKFKNHIRKTNCDGCVVTYTGFHPHMLGNKNYAYVKLIKDQIIDIQEKQPFTSDPMKEYASSGTYYFKSAALMKKYFERTMSDDLNVKGEYYVSLSFKPMIKDNLILSNFNIEYFMQWGTPNDFEEFIWYSNLFKLKMNLNNDIRFNIENVNLMIPCAGLGKRFKDAGYTKPKPFIKVSGKPMVIQAINDMPCNKKINLIFQEAIINNQPDYSQVSKYYEDIYIKLIKSQTRGQAETCLLGLENIDLLKPLIISPCDNGIIYDKKKFKIITEESSTDIIVLGCRKYPGAIRNPQMYGWIEENHNIVKKIYVKNKFKNPKTDPIVVGTFFFKEAQIYKLVAEDLIKSNKKVNNEFYVDSSINHAIKLGYKVKYFEVDYYLCWGTPNDLETYQYWQNCFDKWDQHPYKKELDDDFYK